MTSLDYPDYQAPQAHADRIAATGVPLLSLATSLFNQNTPLSAPGGGLETILASGLQIDQIGYELALSVLANSASTFPFGTLILVWSDSVSGNTVWRDEFAIIGGFPTSQFYAGVGATKGDTLDVGFVNFDPTNAMTIEASMVQNSRVFVRDDLRQINVEAMPGFTRGNYGQHNGFLINTTPSILAADSTERLMAFYGGQVSLSASGPVPYSVFILAYSGGVNNATGTIVFAGSVTAATGGALQESFSLPRAQCVLGITNNGGATESFTATVVVSEQQT